MIMNVLKRPIITEKSINRTRQKYFTFEVEKDASKHQIKQEVEELFSVDVSAVRIINRVGKTKRTGRMRTQKRQSGKKFAMVKIGKDQTIELFTIAPEQTS